MKGNKALLIGLAAIAAAGIAGYFIGTARGRRELRNWREGKIPPNANNAMEQYNDRYRSAAQQRANGGRSGTDQEFVT
jgi:hypothetical protein